MGQHHRLNFSDSAGLFRLTPCPFLDFGRFQAVSRMDNLYAVGDILNILKNVPFIHSGSPEVDDLDFQRFVKKQIAVEL